MIKTAARWASLLTLLVGAGCHPKEGLPQHYEDPEAMIVEFERSERDVWAMPDRVVRSLGIENKEAVIADIGAGSGYFSRRLAHEAPAGKVYAVDVDDTFREHIERNREAWGTPNIEPHLAFYDDPALPAGELDMIFMSNTYPYLRDRIQYLDKLRQALKPGGVLAIVGFRPEATPPADSGAPDPKFRSTVDAITSEAETAGFAFDHEEKFLPHQHFLIYTRAR